MDSPDPQLPEERMCRLADSARELLASGGRLQLLCSSRESDRCPHHPLDVGSQGCGYLQQQMKANIRVWVVPSVMLAASPPLALGDLDLLIIDEGPWFGLLGGIDEAVGAPVEWLFPGWWRSFPAPKHARDKEIALETLAAIQRVLAERSAGEVNADEFKEAGVQYGALGATLRFVWECKVDLRSVVSPGASHAELTRALALAGPINKRVFCACGGGRTFIPNGGEVRFFISMPLAPEGSISRRRGSQILSCAQRPEPRRRICVWLKSSARR
jgi:hypothetical protein